MGITRRGLFATLGTAAAASAAGWAIGRAGGAPDVIESSASADVLDSDAGLSEADRRAGITFPAVPQRHVRIDILDFPSESASQVRERVRAALRTTPVHNEDAGEVTVTVGFAPHHARELWPERAAAASEIPSFPSDAATLTSGGDVAIQVCAETASAVLDTMIELRAALEASETVWSQSGFRDAPTSHGTARITTGFIDGITNPRSAAELAAGVWSDSDLRDTHWVVRRMRVSSDFGRLSTEAQERAIGRRCDTGAPLSGGGAHDDIDLFAKKPDGTLLIPFDAHARRAHPSNIGRGLMLRRSYSIEVESGAGLLFIAFLSDPSTFVLTQRRLEEQDAFIAHTSTDASGAFFVPGEI
ncbi:MAG: Dyp-type peroxidase [Actinomycetota bacterium]